MKFSFKAKNNKLNIKILVCYHKKDKLFKNDIFVPIHCGRAIAQKESKDGRITEEDYKWLLNNMIGDNTGENISELNRDFNEMTAIYWAWKNYDKLGNPDYIGLNHYRRFFMASNRKIKSLLNKYDFISSEYQIFNNSNMYEQWRDAHIEWAETEFLQSAIEKCKSLDKETGEQIEQYIYSGIMGPWCNMFVLSREDFFNYCSFVFTFAFEVAKIPHHDRAMGMFTERLTGFYLYNLAKHKNGYFLEFNNLAEHKFNDYIQEIFSLKTQRINLKKYKVITILGLKIKVKKEKVDLWKQLI